jgi:hypothetical protein
VSDEDSTPRLGDVIRRISEGVVRGTRVAVPAHVVSYEADTRTASVQIEVADIVDGEEGPEVRTPAIINDVPVVFPGSGTTRIRWPLQSGDQVLLLFSSSPLDRWKVRRPPGPAVDPISRRHHHLTDAIAIPGIQTPGNNDGDDDVMIEFTAGGQIHAGGNQALVTKAEFDAHVHGTSGAGGPSTTPSAPITGTTVLKGG